MHVRFQCGHLGGRDLEAYNICERSAPCACSHPGVEKVNRQWWLLCVYVRERTDQLRCTTPLFNYFRPGFPHLTAHLKSLGLSATRMVSIAPCPSRLSPLPFRFLLCCSRFVLCWSFSFPLCSLLVFLAPRYRTHPQNHTQVGIITVIVSFLVIFALMGMSVFGGSRENASYCARGGDLQLPRRRCSWMAMQSNGSNVLPLAGDLPVMDVCMLRQAQACQHVLLSCFDILSASKCFSKYVTCAQEDIRAPAAGRDVTQARSNARSLQGWIPLTVTLTTHPQALSHRRKHTIAGARTHTYTRTHCRYAWLRDNQRGLGDHRDLAQLLAASAHNSTDCGRVRAWLPLLLLCADRVRVISAAQLRHGYLRHVLHGEHWCVLVLLALFVGVLFCLSAVHWCSQRM